MYWDMIQDERCSKLKIYPILQKVLSIFLCVCACTNSMKLFLMPNCFEEFLLIWYWSRYMEFIRYIWREFWENLKLMHSQKSWNLIRLQTFDAAFKCQIYGLYLFVLCKPHWLTFHLLFRKHFCRIILPCWIVPWLSIIFWARANFTPT